MVRALASHARGHWFESSIAHIRDPLLRKGSRFILASILSGVPDGVPNRIGGTRSSAKRPSPPAMKVELTDLTFKKVGGRGPADHEVMPLSTVVGCLDHG